jgi:hypothetical protein
VIAFGKSTALTIGLAMWVAPAICAAQDLTPRAYFPAPEKSNLVILTYAFSDGELVFDATLPITDATGTIHTPVVSVYHAFGLFGRSANVTGSLPFAVGELRGNVAGEDRTAIRRGLADTQVRLAVNIVGGPALSVAEFGKTPLPRAILGASIKVVAPTGQYDPARLINIGANRWGFKPEFGYTGRTGRFVIDAFAGIWLFTANESFGVSEANPLGATRTQDPIGAFEFHVSYDVKPRLWLSADINYWRGGRTSVNGVEGTTTLLANSRFGVTGSVPLTRRQSLKVSYSDGVIVRIGGNFKVLSVGWQYGWIGTQWR